VLVRDRRVGDRWDPPVIPDLRPGPSRTRRSVAGTPPSGHLLPRPTYRRVEFEPLVQTPLFLVWIRVPIEPNLSRKLELQGNFGLNRIGLYLLPFLLESACNTTPAACYINPEPSDPDSPSRARVLLRRRDPPR
jgi:hypothetical protein